MQKRIQNLQFAGRSNKMPHQAKQTRKIRLNGLNAPRGGMWGRQKWWSYKFQGNNGYRSQTELLYGHATTPTLIEASVEDLERDNIISSRVLLILVSICWVSSSKSLKAFSNCSGTVRGHGSRNMWTGKEGVMAGGICMALSSTAAGGQCLGWCSGAQRRAKKKKKKQKLIICECVGVSFCVLSMMTPAKEFLDESASRKRSYRKDGRKVQSIC